MNAVIHDDGRLVVSCTSGNPQLGVMFTPGFQGDVIVSMPTLPFHPMSSVAVHIDREDAEALRSWLGGVLAP